MPLRIVVHLVLRSRECEEIVNEECIFLYPSWEMVSPNRTHDPVLENAYIIKSLSARELSLEDSQKVTVLARRAVSRSGIGP